MENEKTQFDIILNACLQIKLTILSEKKQTKKKLRCLRRSRGLLGWTN